MYTNTEIKGHKDWHLENRFLENEVNNEFKFL